MCVFGLIGIARIRSSERYNLKSSILGCSIVVQQICCIVQSLPACVIILFQQP